MNLLYCIDENYNVQCYTSIKSQVSNTKSPLRIYIIHEDPDTFSKEFVESFSENKIEILEVIKFQESLLKNFSFLNKKFNNSHMSIATYFRIFIEKHLPNDLGEIVYVDPDVICIKNFENEYYKIFKLMKQDNYVISARTSGYASGNEETFQRLGLKNRKYFNAGVMFIDLELWRKKNIGKNLQSLLYKDNYTLFDQDALNTYFDGEYLELYDHMNYFMDQEEQYEKAVIKYIEESAKLLHYVGASKPWHNDSADSKYSSYYQNYYSELGLSKKHIIKKPIYKQNNIFVKFRNKILSLLKKKS